MRGAHETVGQQAGSDRQGDGVWLNAHRPGAGWIFRLCWLARWWWSASASASGFINTPPKYRPPRLPHTPNQKPTLPPQVLSELSPATIKAALQRLLPVPPTARFTVVTMTPKPPGEPPVAWDPTTP
jgi:hypothetical protein